MECHKGFGLLLSCHLPVKPKGVWVEMAVLGPENPKVGPLGSL